MNNETSSLEETRAKQLFSWGSRVIADIDEANSGLLEEDRKAKYQKLAEAPYAFYRGTNHLFWRDFAWDWRMNRFGNYKTRTWVNGDAHAYNFGAFHAHTAGVVYGMNDFDEAVIADYQYDLWRLAISLILIAEENEIGDPDKQRSIIHALADTYLETLKKFAGNSKAKKTFHSAKNTSGKLKKFLKKVESNETSRAEMIEKWTIEEGGKHGFDLTKKDKFEKADETERAQILAAMPGYLATLESDQEFADGFFEVEDIARRIGAGTGSSGTRRYYLLLAGEGAGHGKDDLILDIKQQARPSAYPYATEAQKEAYKNTFAHEGDRHARAYRALAYHADDLLGWMDLKGVIFSVRERSPYKDEFPAEKLNSKKSFVSLAGQWGAILATHHSRARSASPTDFADELRKLTKGSAAKAAFRALVAEVAFGYAEQVRADWQNFQEELA